MNKIIENKKRKFISTAIVPDFMIMHPRTTQAKFDLYFTCFFFLLAERRHDA